MPQLDVVTFFSQYLWLLAGGGLLLTYLSSVLVYGLIASWQISSSLIESSDLKNPLIEFSYNETLKNMFI